MLQVNWQKDLLFRVVTLEMPEISRQDVEKIENYTC